MFWSPALPEYSPVHALGANAYFLAFYLCATLGLMYAHAFKRLFALCGSSVLLFTMTSLVTIVDYDQRYRLPAELFLVPMAGLGLACLLERVVPPRVLGRARIRYTGPPVTAR